MNTITAAPVDVLRVRNLLLTDTHLPVRAHATDAGIDLKYAGDTPVTLTPSTREMLATGIAVAIPEGWAGLVVPRSGLAAKHGVTVLNAPGLIDPGYRGEVKVILTLVGTTEPYVIQPLDRIAQLVLTPAPAMPVTVVDTLDASERGAGGFGSTGHA